MTGMAFLLIGALIRNRELVGINKELLTKTAKRQRAPRTKADEYRKLIEAFVVYKDWGGFDAARYDKIEQDFRAALPQGPQDAS